MLKIENVSKIYRTKSKEEVIALDNVNLSFGNNELIFIVGQSGSGKTTLLNLIGGLDIPSSGKIEIDNKILGETLTLESYRQNYIGFVFQDYNLLEHLSVFDNIALAVPPCPKVELQKRVTKVLEEVGLSGYEKRKINELSGGQKQRVAIARALAKNSVILLCDEPTGNLDSKTSKEIFNLLKKISADKTVVIVSHNEELSKKYADRILSISDGKIIKDETLLNTSTNQIKKEIKENKVSFLYLLKLGFHNLFLHKVKATVAFVLLLLSLVSMCAMQICISYNSERNIAQSLETEKTIVVLKNKGDSDVSNMAGQNVPLDYDFSAVLNQEQYRIGYHATFATIFTINDKMEEKEFYFKNEIDGIGAYVTDYFIKYVVNAEGIFNDFGKIEFVEYAELENKEVNYKGTTLFTIAGIVKTDYEEYVDTNGELKENSDLPFNDRNIYNRMAKYKLNYNYKVVYTTENVFNTMFLSGGTSDFYIQNGYNISIGESNTDTNIDNISLIDSAGQPREYYNNFGNYGITNSDMQADEIVINGTLYNCIFGTSIDWLEFDRNYEEGFYNGTPVTNSLTGIGKTLNLIIRDDKNQTVIDISNKRVKGVTASNKIEFENNYSIYGTKECFNFKNSDLIPIYETEIILKNVENKQCLFEMLRKDNIVIAGAKASLIYEKEYIIRQMSYFFIGLTIVFAVITFISTFNLVNAKIRDKEKEIGILMGIGFRNNEICFIYLFSMICMMLLAFAMNVVVMYIGVSVINSLLQVLLVKNIVYFAVDIFTYLSMSAVGIVIVFASLIPLIALSKKKPIDIIKK